jgi:hypothetical protein
VRNLGRKGKRHSDGSPPKTKVKRESWAGKYVVVARKQGRIVTWGKWKGKSDSEKVNSRVQSINHPSRTVPYSRDEPIRQPSYQPVTHGAPFTKGNSRYVYVVKGIDKFGSKKTLTTTSPQVVDLTGKRSRNRLMLYEYLKEKYESYDFEINGMKLVSTWDQNLHKEINHFG